MKNLSGYTGFKTEINKTNDGIITTISSKNGISKRSNNIEWNNKTVFANYVYNNDETYNVVYSIIDFEGNVQENYLENNGILPTLFKTPDNELYVSITIYHPDKELEISVPLINREVIKEPKQNKQFAGKYTGNIHQSVIFYDIDIFSDKKQDKMLNIEFKNGTIYKKHNIKIEFPKNNKIYIHNNEIHLFGKIGNYTYLHRQIDEFGKELKQREIKTDGYWPRELLTLAFEENSCFISDKNGKITFVEIDKAGNCTTVDLIDIHDEIYNAFQPISIGNGIFVINYNTEFGNGWFTIKDNTIVEFYYDKGKSGYKNILTNETISIGSNDLIIEGINKTIENGYAVLFSNNTKGKEKNKEIIILNKIIK